MTLHANSGCTEYSVGFTANLFTGKARASGEIKRPAIVGIVTNEDTVTRLIGALLLEQNDEWAVQRPAT